MTWDDFLEEFCAHIWVFNSFIIPLVLLVWVVLLQQRCGWFC
jgi:hypothetical protein